MTKITCEDGEVPVGRSRRDGDIGEAGRAAGCPLPVHQQSRLSSCGGVEGNNPCAVEMEDEFEPIVETCGSPGSSGPSEPGNAAGNLCDRDRGEEEDIGVRIHPFRQRSRAFPPARRSR